MTNMQLFEQLIEFVLASRPVQVCPVFENGEDVLLDGQFAEYRGFLRQVAKAERGPAVHRQRRQVLSVEQYLSAVRGDQADDHIERGRLSCTIRDPVVRPLRH